MYENEFSQNNRDALDSLMYSVDAVKSVNTNKLSDVVNTSLCSDPEYSAKQEELFNRAEQWLNGLGIETRTEYGNVLPTYNLFLKIGEWLENKTIKEVGVYRQPSKYDIETRMNSFERRLLGE